jgi:hypothetical protein
MKNENKKNIQFLKRKKKQLESTQVNLLNLSLE